MKNLILVFSLCLPLICHADDRSREERVDSLRNAAMNRFEQHHDRRNALRLNRQAIRLARQLPETNWRTIENYDDAGLYYYDSRKWKLSAQHQAIAVLLACNMPESGAMFATYVKRLGFAFAKYRPAQDFDAIAANPLLLLQDLPLNLRSNFDLRRRYFNTIKLKPTGSNQQPRYLYRLRKEQLPDSCYIRSADKEPETNEQGNSSSEP
ncbi:hypothetical protein [Undibacterium sp. TS12]|uniref:hypothetical protein n=1 Tax=Undibacterium sp. TS12 TaxID=2908202 RepID=UPI001F4C8D36|nr:hypothetical protein [Undibacterium sp. TS12]MCH8620858.1 hypothetical protein [Undibacterium sp. TS12]